MILFFCWIFAGFFVLNFAKCPDGSIASISNPSNCYFFESQMLNFMGAEEFCIKNYDGHLVSIHNAFDDAFVNGEAATVFTDSANDDFWIGANNLLIPGNWSWMDGTPFDFIDWGKGQPVNTTGSNCGAMQLSTGMWSATDCLRIQPFVCITATKSTTAFPIETTTKTLKPQTCLSSWTFYNTTGYCYRSFCCYPWTIAEETCKIDGAHLASIHSQDEALFIANIAYTTPDNCDSNIALIGFHTEDDDSSWRWTDGTPFDFANWSPGNPDNPGKDNCGALYLSSMCDYKAGQFNNFACGSSAKFVCKMLPS